MTNKESDIDEKILCILNGRSTSAEKARLDEWINISDEHRQYYREKIREFRKVKMALNLSEADSMKQQIELNLAQAIRQQNQLCRLRRRRIGWKIGITAVALAIIAVGIGLSHRLHRERHTGEPLLAQLVISPGRSVATITLANGEQLSLGNNNRNVREENGTILKMDSSVVTYRGTTTENSEITYNTLSVPAGGEYRLVLADNTKVWMNASSKLKYPVVFSGKQREVFLEGEAYFEVEKDGQHPFVVHTSRGIIKVLGTGFNVRDYQEEARVVTTLVEGKVVYRPAERFEEVFLSPGFQLEDNGIDELSPRQVDVGMYVGWKDGKYVFEDATLEEIMQVLSGWYDVTVFYKREELKHLHFTGDLERYENINDFLHFMELGGKVIFNIHEKTIIIE